MVWHFQQAYGLITMPLAGVSTSFTLFTFLDVRYHVALTWWQYIGFYGFVMLGGAGVGVMVKRAGFLKYLSNLNNEQNEMMMKIDDILKEIKK